MAQSLPSNHREYKMSIEILAEMAALDAGIIPRTVWASKAGPVNDDRWGSLTDEERKCHRRKFRKLWRQACKMFAIENPGSKLWSPRARMVVVEAFLRKKVQKSVHTRAK